MTGVRGPQAGVVPPSRTADHGEEIDLIVCPIPAQIKTPVPGAEIAIGDIHGNVVKLAHFLITQGIIELKDPDGVKNQQELYDELQSLYYSMTMLDPNANIERIMEIINNSEVRPEAQGCLVRLIGDDLADRGNSDIPTLRMMAKLQESTTVDFKVAVSNHGLGALKVYSILAESDSYEDFKQKYREYTGTEFNDYMIQHRGGLNFKFDHSEQATSLRGMMKALRDAAEPLKTNLFRQVKKDYSSYMEGVKLIDYSLNADGEMLVYTHAPIDLRDIKTVAEYYGLLADSDYLKPDGSLKDDPENLCALFDEVNKKFMDRMRPTGSPPRIPGLEDIDVPQEARNTEANKIFNFVWARRADHLGDDYQIPDHITFIHGHDGPDERCNPELLSKIEGRLINLDDSVVGKPGYTKGSVPTYHAVGEYRSYSEYLAATQPAVTVDTSVTPAPSILTFVVQVSDGDGNIHDIDCKHPMKMKAFETSVRDAFGYAADDDIQLKVGGKDISDTTLSGWGLAAERGSKVQAAFVSKTAPDITLRSDGGPKPRVVRDDGSRTFNTAVRDIYGKRYYVELPMSCTLEDFNKKVREVFGYKPEDEFKVIFNGRYIDSQKFLDDFKSQAGNVNSLHVVKVAPDLSKTVRPPISQPPVPRASQPRPHVVSPRPDVVHDDHEGASVRVKGRIADRMSRVSTRLKGKRSGSGDMEFSSSGDGNSANKKFTFAYARTKRISKMASTAKIMKLESEPDIISEEQWQGVASKFVSDLNALKNSPTVAGKGPTDSYSDAYRREGREFYTGMDAMLNDEGNIEIRGPVNHVVPGDDSSPLQPDYSIDIARSNEGQVKCDMEGQLDDKVIMTCMEFHARACMPSQSKSVSFDDASDMDTLITGIKMANSMGMEVHLGPRVEQMVKEHIRTQLGYVGEEITDKAVARELENIKSSKYEGVVPPPPPPDGDATKTTQKKKPGSARQ